MPNAATPIAGNATNALESGETGAAMANSATASGPVPIVSSDVAGSQSN